MFSHFTPSAAAPDPDDGDRNDSHRKRMNAKSRSQQEDVCEIGLPPERDWDLWRRYQFDLHAFLQEVFPHSTGKSKFSKKHRKLIDESQEAVIDGGQVLNEVFRGGAKSTITENTAIWATHYGHRKFFVPIGATDESAQIALDSIQMEIVSNPRLMALFPAVCHAAIALEGIPQRARKQTMGAVKTMIQWTTRRCVLPTVDGFEGSGAIIWPRSITASSLRGMRFKRPDGEQARPDFVMIDDPQTDESASSNAQITKLEKTIRRTVLRLGGHDKAIACVCNATPIEPGDLVDRLAKDPAWRVNLIPILESRAENEDFWFGEYADLRLGYRDGDKRGKRAAIKASNALYKKKRKIADKGAKATWPELFNDDELSAIQHAYNMLLEIGEDAFLSECMLNPPREQSALQRLTVDEICLKQSEFEQGVVPPDCTVLVAKIDVHPSILYANIWAFAPGFTGYLTDYPNFPDQGRDHFIHTNITRTLQKKFPKRDVDAQITAGLKEFLIGEEGKPGLLHREWFTPKGISPRKSFRLVKVAIDGNGQANQAVNNFILGAHEFRGVLYPEFGRGITCRQNPMHTWPEARAQTKSGPGWIETKGPPVGSMFDTNYWKTRFHRALALEPGSRGALYLFKAPPRKHRMFAEHCLAEPVKEVTIENRTVHEFGEPKAGDGNHDFDCGVGCMVAASKAGITNLTKPTKQKRSGPPKARFVDGW